MVRGRVVYTYIYLYWCHLNLALAPFAMRRVLVTDDGKEWDGIGWEPICL